MVPKNGVTLNKDNLLDEFGIVIQVVDFVTHEKLFKTFFVVVIMLNFYGVLYVYCSVYCPLKLPRICGITGPSLLWGPKKKCCC